MKKFRTAIKNYRVDKYKNFLTKELNDNYDLCKNVPLNEIELKTSACFL